MSTKYQHVLAVTALGLASCGGVMLGVTYKEALEKRDYPALQKVCLREVVLTTGNSRDSDVERACEASVEIAEEKQDTAYIEKACTIGEYRLACNKVENAKLTTSLSGASCEELPGKLEKQSVFKMSAQQRSDVFAKLIDCGAGAYIFEKLAHYGEMGSKADSVLALKEADKRSNGGLKKLFVEYAEANSGDSFLNDEHGEFAANHIGNWLEQSQHKDLCKPLTTAVTGASEKIRANILFYFSDNNCKEALPIATELLASSSPQHRLYACNNLADFGDKSVLKKVKTLAETDTYYEIQQRDGFGVKVFVVADACKQAFGKIQLRTE